MGPGQFRVNLASFGTRRWLARRAQHLGIRALAARRGSTTRRVLARCVASRGCVVSRRVDARGCVASRSNSSRFQLKSLLKSRHFGFRPAWVNCGSFGTWRRVGASCSAPRHPGTGSTMRQHGPCRAAVLCPALRHLGTQAPVIRPMRQHVALLTRALRRVASSRGCVPLRPNLLRF